MATKTCLLAKREEVKQKNTPQKRTSMMGRSWGDNLLQNGGFEDPITMGWTPFSYVEAEGQGWSQNSNPSAPEGLSDLLWENVGGGSNGGYIYQLFKNPKTKCITEFNLSFWLKYESATAWAPGSSDIHPMEDYIMGAQEIIIQITDEYDRVLKQVLRTNPGDPLTSDYALYETTFNAKTFPFPLLQFPENLKLRVRVTSVTGYLRVQLDKVVLVGKCKKSEEHERSISGEESEKNSVDISLASF